VRGGLRLVAQDVVLKSTIWGLCKVRVHGLERLDNLEPPFIVVANHSSHLDAPLIVGALPHRLSKNLATGAAADYFFDKRVKGMATSLFFNAYPIERKGLRTRQGLTGRLLDSGVPLLVFPEGTRSRTGAMGPFKPGVAALSISRDVPCLPVALVGAYAAWPYYRSIPPTDRPQVHVVFGHPVTAVAGEIAHQFAQRLGRNVAELYNTTARAYGMPTLDDYERSVVLSRAKRSQDPASSTSPTSPTSPGGEALGSESRPETTSPAAPSSEAVPSAAPEPTDTTVTAATVTDSTVGASVIERDQGDGSDRPDRPVPDGAVERRARPGRGAQPERSAQGEGRPRRRLFGRRG
jgi:1-acyl-sn-glycerol-3-phosphate acyltransferase